MLYEVATVILTRTSPRNESSLRIWGLELPERLGFKRAAVAVARKLTVIMHSILKTGEVFWPAQPHRKCQLFPSGPITAVYASYGVRRGLYLFLQKGCIRPAQRCLMHAQTNERPQTVNPKVVNHAAAAS